MIYLLKRNDNIGYDEYNAKIVRARNEKEARDVANQYCGDEGQMWANEAKVSCEKISSEGKSEMLLGSFIAG